MRFCTSLIIIISFLKLNVALGTFERDSKINTTQFSDEDKEGIGKTSGDIVQSALNSPSVEADKMPLNTNVAGSVLDGLKEVPAPKPQSLSRNARKDVPVLCDIDYSTPCPKGYLLIGDIQGKKSSVCAPLPSYDGPCVGDTLDLSVVKSDISRKTWSRKCMTDWPCKKCTRHYSKQCPENWKAVNGSSTACIPTGDYRGPCKGTKVDFNGYNAYMREDWSHVCRAWWPCIAEKTAEMGPDPDMPLTKNATVWRVLKGHQ